MSIAAADIVPVHKNERRAWVLYDVANSPFYQTVLTVLLPVYMTDIIKVAFKDEADPNNIYILGFPLLIDSVFPFFSSVSVFFQVLTFFTFSSMADYGNNRRSGLLFLCAAGALLQCCWIFITEDIWVVGCIVFVLTNVIFGLGIVFYNSFLPILVAESDKVLEAKREGKSPAELHHLEHELGNELSSHGQEFGYLGSVVNLGISLALVLLIPDVFLGSRLGLFAVGVWWGGIGCFSILNLKNRGGPPLPEGRHYLTIGWQHCFITLRRIRRLPEMFKFLLSYFIYSDAVSTVTYTSAIFASQIIGLPISLIIASILVFLVTAIAGNLVYQKMIDKGFATAQQILVSNLVVYLVIPFIGFFGLKEGAVGLYFTLVVIYGINIGSIGSYSRSLYAHLIPPGRESEMFGFFEISDKGTGWLGPLLVTVISSATGDLRNAFWVLLVFLLFGIPILWSVDMDKGQREARAYPKDDDLHKSEPQETPEGLERDEVKDAIYHEEPTDMFHA